MRTTLTLEEPVDRALRELVARRHVPYREMVNQTLRVGLALLKRTLK